MQRQRILFTLVALLFSISALAQQASPPKQAAAVNSSQGKADAEKKSPKEGWTKQYNDLKPQLDKYVGHVKQEGTKHPEFSTEVKKLDQMVTAFKGRIDKYDTATEEERKRYDDMMKNDHLKIQEQLSKVKGMWHQYHPEQDAASPKTVK